MKKWNHYTCPKCKGVTVARHDDEGVTPFLIRCRAKDVKHTSGIVMPGCTELAQSCFFDCDQSDEQTPQVIFYRPEPQEAIKEINKSSKREREWLLEHYAKGGSLMRTA